MNKYGPYCLPPPPYLSTPYRDHYFGLDPLCQQLVIGSALAVGGILAYLLLRKQPQKTIPVGEGWWGAGEKPTSEDDKIHPFKVQTSDAEIQVSFFIDVYKMKGSARNEKVTRLFFRTSTSASTVLVTLMRWRIVPSSMASMPLI